jgi:dTDP-4-amino-4,6-dideoxygalactose transaminase
MIPFNKHCVTGNEFSYINNALSSSHISGDGEYTKACNKWFKTKLECKSVLLTSSCTHALEMAAILLNIRAGDEIIMPSYTFVSTANAFVLRGATIVFVDVRPDTMNIDENKIEHAITDRTKAIVPVHYAGVGCDMDAIMHIANRYGLFVVEDAAQGMMASYKARFLGTIGHIGAFSFHQTKNYTSAGEGGLLILNDDRFIERAEIIREKGTNRSKFFRGMVDKYSWVDIGSSYLMSDVSAAYLLANIEKAELINRDRLTSWNTYYNELTTLKARGKIILPIIPAECRHNGHMFYFKVKNLETRTSLIKYLHQNGVECAFHYVPLHSSPAGLKFGRFDGDDTSTSKESEVLIRLPMYYGLKKNEIEYICSLINKFLLHKY